VAEEPEMENETAAAGMMATAGHTERDIAQGVTRWLIGHFHSELTDAVKSTPFTVPLLCAIACREAGIYWLPLTPNRPAAEILGLCIYDASGDVAGAPRSAFPTNTAQFRLAYGDAFTNLLIAETNKARAVRGYSAASMVYKGYGIFQYDLQFVRTDEAFFRGRQWYSFSACVERAVSELTGKYQALGDIQEAVRAYNGSGPRAQQYARDVMRLLPYCEEAAAAGPAVVAGGGETAHGYTMIESAARAAQDDDPAFPNGGDADDTADFETARMLANLGAPGASESGDPGGSTFAAGGVIDLDIARARAFLEACRTSRPRVTYGLGKKVPFLSAVPGRDFTRVDCSGFVREAIRRSTNPMLRFPDGSVVQHDWVRDRGLERSTIADGMRSDGLVRLAFLRPQDSPQGIGHVVLIIDGWTLESHGGVGPNTREWKGEGWQAKAYVYVLARAARFAAPNLASTGLASPNLASASLASANLASAELPAVMLALLAALAPADKAPAAQAPATRFTVRTGHRYRATISLGPLERFAGNDTVAGVLGGYGFSNVVVTGSGATRYAEATWSGPDTTAPVDARLSDITDTSPVAAPQGAFVPSAPAVVRGDTSTSGRVAASVFTAQSLPEHHDGLLVVKMRQETLRYAPEGAMMAAAAAAPAPETQGLDALSFFERAGRVKQVIPLRERPAPDGASPARVEAVTALTFTARRPEQADSTTGVRFIEMSSEGDTRQLLDALAGDPNVHSVSQVPIRYLAARRPGRAGIQATPPAAPALWNLERIRWAQARQSATFEEARDIRVAVLDTGVDDAHPDLEIDQYHWQHGDLARRVTKSDIIGHGTHVAGTIAARIDNGPSVQGICACKLSVFKIFDDEPTDAPGQGAFVYYVNPVMYRRALSACIENPVDVINLSIGGPAPPDATERYLFEQLLEAGVTICAAMGNERQYHSPTSYPAAIPGVIAVGATGLDDRVTAFSNSGTHIAVAAPGKAIWSTLPTYSGQTRFDRTLGPDGLPKPAAPVRRELNYDAWDGTSMATPHVSGCAALFLARGIAAKQRPTPAQVREALMKSADKVPGMGGADFSTDYGAGRLNLLNLLA